ncbi:hypothetical protein [Sulfurospirillum barnesii]|uniref:Uncharacterized protein n=1 Tax=Sulfurospirillum barnesii (strain ATCC 700032 / DSM 10660 / SES-3) TaxID=760154 RepID=I3Y053_SULBS|nr:hypothetical protein [Sulfurospirillum barnesii]AFL69577.1 hypothetical protein Sulba_2302 [Sulfurospirillum barnesii SES-3]
MFKTFREDVWNISDEETKSIKSKEILLKEYEHINKLVEEKAQFTSNLTLLIISGTGILFWNVVQGVVSILKYFSENKDSKKMVEFMQDNLPSFVEVVIESAFIFAVFFAFMCFFDLWNKQRLINRKVLILNLLKHNKEQSSIKTLLLNRKERQCK